MKQIQDLRQEILQEMAKQPGPTETSHKSLLKPKAPLFTPLGSKATTTPTASSGGGGGAGEGACTTKTMQRTTHYDDCSTWEAYRTQFKMLARVNNWNEVKATYLAVSLKRPALAMLSNIPRDNLYSYSSLVTALEACFRSAHQVELHLWNSI